MLDFDKFGFFHRGKSDLKNDPFKKERSIHIKRRQTPPSSIDSILEWKPQKKSEIRDKAISELLFQSGLRATELTTIRMEKINFMERTLVVTGKGMKERICFFGKIAHEWMDQYVSEVRLKMDPQWKLPFFLSFNAKPMTRHQVYRAMESVSKKSNCPHRFNPHAFRKAFATVLHRRGVDLEDIAWFMGHSSIQTTADYIHLASNDLIKTFMKYHPRAGIVSKEP